MNIIEVRDGFIKFDANDDVFLSSFVLINDESKKYVAQVMQLTSVAGKHVACAKILFLFDNGLQMYDNTIPSKSAEIKDFTFNILNNSINAKEPIIAGVTSKKDISIIVDSSAFNNKMIVSIDDKKNNNILVRNLSKQFNNINKNVVIIDTLGIIEANKYIAGKDFKLPLDTASLNFMYEDCLNDATADSKSMIIDIFKDLAEYSKTVPFLPFKVLKSIVEEMVDKSHIFKLLVLKNKLIKFDKLGYFAANSEEVNIIDKILTSKCSIIDLSKLDIAFQNRYLAYIYEKLETKKDVQVVLELSNTTSKKNLKNIMLNEKVSTTFFTHSRFKYLNDIKNHFDNFIIEPSITNNQIFKVYSSFLRAMKTGEYLIAGEGVNYIPVISQVKIIDQFIPNINVLDKNVVEDDLTEINPLEKKVETESVENIEVLNNASEPIIEDGNITQNAIACISNESDVGSDLLEENNVVNTELPVESSEEVLSGEECDDINDESVSFEENTDNNDLELLQDEDVEEDIPDIIETNEVEEPCVSKEEIIENIDRKSEAVIADITSDTLSEPENLFDDTEELENFEDKDDIKVESNFEPLDNSSSDDSFLELDDEDYDENSNSEQVYEIVNDNDEQELISEFSEENDNQEFVPEVINGDNNDLIDEYVPLENELAEEVLLEDAPIDMSDSEIIDFSKEDISENEIVEQISMVDEFDSSNELEELDLVASEYDTQLQSELADDNEINLVEETSDTENIESDNNEEVEIPDGVDFNFDEEQQNDEIVDELSDDNLHEMDLQEELMPLDEDSDNLEEIVELDPSDTDANDIVVDIAEEDELSENIDELIVQDVDKVFTTRKEDDISESDLDFIDELNSDGGDDILQETSDDGNILEELSEMNDDGILEQPQKITELKEQNDENNDILETKNSTTPIVPVYDAEIPEEDVVKSDPIQQGDTVVHAKYGTGLVEKMIKYGNKTLFSINFDNVGRRLLDPTLTELKKA